MLSRSCQKCKTLLKSILLGSTAHNFLINKICCMEELWKKLGTLTKQEKAKLYTLFGYGIEMYGRYCLMSRKKTYTIQVKKDTFLCNILFLLLSKTMVKLVFHLKFSLNHPKPSQNLCCPLKNCLFMYIHIWLFIIQIENVFGKNILVFNFLSH